MILNDLVWFRMMASFCGTFFRHGRVLVYLTQLFWLYENVVFDLLLRLWRIRLPCCGKGVRVGRVVCFGRLFGLV